VFELPGQPRLAEEARRDGGVTGFIRQQFLEGHFPVQMSVARQPDPANPTGTVETLEGIPRFRGRIACRRSRYFRAGRPDRFERPRVPDESGLIVTRGQEAGTVGMERHVVDHVAMWERLANGFAGRRVPELGRLVRAARQDH
jgi:hypothetical protein